MRLRLSLVARLLLLIFLLGNQWCGFVFASSTAVVAWEQAAAGEENTAEEVVQLQPPTALLWQPESARVSIDSSELFGRNSVLPQSANFLLAEDFPAPLSGPRSLWLPDDGPLAGLPLLLQHGRLQL